MKPHALYSAALLLLAAATAAHAAYDFYHLTLDAGYDPATKPLDLQLYLTLKDGEASRVLLLRQNPEEWQDDAFKAYIAYGNPAANLQVPTNYKDLDLAFGPSAITGTATLTYKGDASESLPLAVALTITGENVGGTVTFDGVTYPVDGKRYSEATQNAVQDIPAGHNWPRMMGPNDDNIATPHGGPLLEDKGDFRLAWISEEVTAAGSAGSRFKSNPPGGSAGPVVADGKVFLSYYVPSGDTVVDWDGRPKDKAVPPWNLLDADDVVVAVDARTGETVWKQVFPERAVTWSPHKTMMQGITPVIEEGVLYAMGAAGHINALDTATGTVLWTSRLPGTAWIDDAKEAIRSDPDGDLGDLPLSGRSGGHSLNFADGVLLAGPLDSRRNLHGINGGTGAHLWTRYDVMGKKATPAVWEHDGKAYALVLSRGGDETPFDSVLRCIDPQDGSTVWEEGDLGYIHRELLVHDERLIFLLVDGGAGAPGTWACFELGPGGLTHRWTLDSAYEAGGFVNNKAPGGGAFVVDGKAWLRVTIAGQSGGHVALASLTDGSVEQTIQYDDDVLQQSTQVASDNLVLLSRDEQHGDYNPNVMTINGRNFGQWHPNVPNNSGYAVPWTSPIVDGRIFIRGMDAIYAYDLRQHPAGRPYARFTATPSTGSVDTVFTFDAGDSLVPDGPATYSWTFGDGATGSGPTVTHQYSAAGPYKVQLIVEDASGRTHERIHEVAVADTPPATPDSFSAVGGSRTEIFLDWVDNADDELGYRLERRQAAEDPFAVVADLPPNTTTYTDNGLTLGTAYEYRLTAYNEGYDAVGQPVAAATTLSEIFDLWLEIECSEDLNTDVWNVIDDPTASNGTYLIADASTDRPPSPEMVTPIRFTAPFQANYKVWARVHDVGGAANSFWLKVDGDPSQHSWTDPSIGPWEVFDTGHGGWLRWVEFRGDGRLDNLSAGEHTLWFSVRESDTHIDKLYITTSNDVPTGLGGEALNCAAPPLPEARIANYTGDQADIVIPSETGKLYTLEEAPSPAGPWTAVPDQTAEGTEGELTFTADTPAPDRWFFRIRIEDL